MKDFRKMKPYKLAYDLGLDVLKVADTFPPDKDIDIQRDLTASGTKVAAKIAASSAWNTIKGKTRLLMIALGNAQIFDSSLTLAHERGLIDEATYGRLLSKLIDVRDELEEMLEAPFRDKRGQDEENLHGF
jgi:four helix bundle protein